MSKGNMLLGHARGKVGSLVFSRSNGKQVVRAKADVVKNPQTRAQVIQRIFLNTVSQAYSKMATICDHSFEGIAKGQDSMSYFMRVNLNKIRATVAEKVAAGYYDYEILSFTPIGSNVLVPNTYEVSKGQLPAIPVQDNNDDNKMAFALDANTYQGVLDAYGLQRGDQLTFVAIIGTDADHTAFSYARVILNPMNNEGQEVSLDTQFIADGGINMPNIKNEGSFASIAFANSKVAFGFGSTYLFGAAIIVSRKGEDGNWLRSTSALAPNESGAELYYSLGYALDKFAEGSFTTESQRYLNNAGVVPTIRAGVHERNPRIAAASFDGVDLVRDSVNPNGLGEDAANLVVGTAELEDGVTYKVGLKAVNSTSVSHKTAITNGSATISVAEIDLADRALVLLADDVVVDTYCSWGE